VDEGPVEEEGEGGDVGVYQAFVEGPGERRVVVEEMRTLLEWPRPEAAAIDARRTTSLFEESYLPSMVAPCPATATVDSRSNRAMGVGQVPGADLNASGPWKLETQLPAAAAV
jgi:hypothetical protein